MKSVVDFIKEDCVFHSPMYWKEGDHYFDIKLLPHRTKGSMVGIYFITALHDNKLHVLKVGKADGVEGFYRRFNNYGCFSCDESIINKMPQVMEMFPGCEIRMYYHVMEQKKTKYKGYTIDARADARGFEIAMSRLASREEHPLLLSRNI
jgi:hypothetical protein